MDPGMLASLACISELWILETYLSLSHSLQVPSSYLPQQVSFAEQAVLGRPGWGRRYQAI